MNMGFLPEILPNVSILVEVKMRSNWILRRFQSTPNPAFKKETLILMVVTACKPL